MMTKLAQLKTSWQRAIGENSVLLVRVEKDGSVLVQRLVKATVEGQTVKRTVFNQYKGSDLNARALLEVIGPLVPGQSRQFLSDAVSKDELYTPELLNFRLASGDYKSAEIDASGHITLERISKSLGNPVRVTFSKPEQLEVIIKVTGPLTPGEIHLFDNEWMN